MQAGQNENVATDEFAFDTSGLELDDVESETIEGNPDADEFGERAEQRWKLADKSDDQLPLYFDIETVPDEERLEQFDLPPLPKPKPKPKELPKPEEFVAGTVNDVKKMLAEAAWPAEFLSATEAAEVADKNRSGVTWAIGQARKEDLSQAIADRQKLLSTTPEFCRIVAIGIAIGSGDIHGAVDLGDDNKESLLGFTECEMLEMFWSCATKCSPLIGFNCLHFDLPVIFFRSALLGVEPTRLIDMKPWGRDVLDLYLRRFGQRGNTDKKRPGSLKKLAPLCGIKVPAGDVDGSQVAALAKSDPEKLGQYVCSDVEVTRKLHRFYSGYFCE